MTLSIIIITHNEAANIKNCLESVKFADEIIVVDSGSTDNTVAICQQYTQNIFQTDWPGFGRQKNRALQYVSGDWILSLDADEQLSPELKTEIQKAIYSREFQAYAIPRQSKYCGKTIQYGAWRNDKVIRLFQRGKAIFSDDDVHERLIVDGKIGTLIGKILHDSFQDLEEVLSKVNHYSSAGAKQRAQRGKKSNISKAILHGMWTFIRDYFIKRGFLDGREGFMLAVSNAEGCYYSYVKLMFLNEQESLQNSKPQNTQT